MPEHRLLAILRIFKIDAVVVEVAPDLGWVEVAVEIFEDGEGIEKLLFRLIDQVDAVSIQHLAIAFQHTHHLKQVISCIAEQGFTAQQAALHLLLINRQIGVNQLLGDYGHLSSLRLQGWLRQWSPLRSDCRGCSAPGLSPRLLQPGPGQGLFRVAPHC